jgi:hypothetical protein
MGYGLRVRASIPGRINVFFSTPNLRTSSGFHSISSPVDVGGISPGKKQPGCEANHSTPSYAELKNGYAVPLLPYMFAWICA